MIAISSFRPRKDCSLEIWRNQVAAVDSWQNQFDEIYFFGKYEPELDSDITSFFVTEGNPSIRNMASFAGRMWNWVAIINADIILSSEFCKVTDRMIANTAIRAAISGRYNFNFGDDLSTAQQTDNGIDLFAAHPAIWRKVGQFMPEEFRLGKCAWDTNCLGMFNQYTHGNVGDLTPARLLFHPYHGDRGDQSTPESALKSPFMQMAKWPSIKIV